MSFGSRLRSRIRLKKCFDILSVSKESLQRFRRNDDGLGRCLSNCPRWTWSPAALDALLHRGPPAPQPVRGARLAWSRSQARNSRASATPLGSPAGTIGSMSSRSCVARRGHSKRALSPKNCSVEWSVRAIIRIAPPEFQILTCHCVQMVGATGSAMMSSTEAMISLTVWWRCLCVRSSGLAISKSLGVNSRPTSAAKTSFHGFCQTCCANTSLSRCHSFSICRASALLNPQYPVSANPFS